MTRWSRCRCRQVVCLAFLSLATISSTRPATAAAPPDSLLSRVSRLRQAGAYEHAFAVAEELLVQRRNDPDSRPDQIADAVYLRSTLEKIRGLSPAARAELAAADSLDQSIAQLDAKGLNREGAAG